MNNLKPAHLARLVALAITVAGAPALADGAAGADELDDAKVSIDGLRNFAGTSGGFARKAEYCLAHGYVEQAIKLCQASINVSNDPDLHQIYAEALETKLKSENDEQDPALYRKCVSEWLIVLRQAGGEENLSFNGLSLPGLSKFYEDEDRSIPAKQHILNLTGRLPKLWETNEKFLSRVNVASKQSVSGTVIKNRTPTLHPEETSEHAKKRDDQE